MGDRTLLCCHDKITVVAALPAERDVEVEAKHNGIIALKSSFAFSRFCDRTMEVEINLFLNEGGNSGKKSKRSVHEAFATQ